MMYNEWLSNQSNDGMNNVLAWMSQWVRYVEEKVNESMFNRYDYKIDRYVL